jgi:hypothetical protein
MATEESTREYKLTVAKGDITIVHTSLGRKLDELQRNEQTEQAAEICSLADRLYTEFSSQFGAPVYSVTVSESDLRRIHGALQNRVGARRSQKEAVQRLLTHLEALLTGHTVCIVKDE